MAAPEERPAHAERIWQVAVHPRQKLLVTCSADRSAKVWRLPDLELVKTLDQTHTRSIRSASWKPHGPPVLALGSFDATASVWMKEDDEYEFLAQLEGHENEVKRVAWSGDARFLATCSRDKSVWVWEVDESNEDFECVAVLQEHEQDVKHVVWHPQEELLASTSYDDTIRLWRRDDDVWISVSDLKGHEGTVWGADFESYPSELYYGAEDDVTTSELPPARLVSCSEDLTVRIWQRKSSSGGTKTTDIPSVARWDVRAEEWEQVAILPAAHSHAIYSVKWGKHGIASVSADGKVVVYKESGPGEWTIVKKIERAHGVFEVNSVDWYDDQIITGGDDGKVKMWSLES